VEKGDIVKTRSAKAVDLRGEAKVRRN